jgi:hypothetical protein
MRRNKERKKRLYISKHEREKEREIVSVSVCVWRGRV